MVSLSVFATHLEFVPGVFVYVLVRMCFLLVMEMNDLRDATALIIIPRSDAFVMHHTCDGFS